MSEPRIPTTSAGITYFDGSRIVDVDLAELASSVTRELNIPDIKFDASDSTVATYKALSPGANASDVGQFTELVHRLDKEHKDRPISFDPRLFNNPLPSQSVISFQYGARSYNCDLYPGFTWRNGTWYKTTPELKFSPAPIEGIYIRRSDMQHAPDLGNRKIPDVVATIDDLYYPVFINSNRVFIREVWVKRRGEQPSQCVEAYCYFPDKQLTTRLENVPGVLPRFNRDAQYASRHEDPAFMTELPQYKSV